VIIVTYTGLAWLIIIIMVSGFDDWLYWHVNYNGSQIELRLSDESLTLTVTNDERSVSLK
jgi:hypothetical protein